MSTTNPRRRALTNHDLERALVALVLPRQHRARSARQLGGDQSDADAWARSWRQHCMRERKVSGGSRPCRPGWRVCAGGRQQRPGPAAVASLHARLHAEDGTFAAELRALTTWRGLADYLATCAPGARRSLAEQARCCLADATATWRPLVRYRHLIARPGRFKTMESLAEAIVWRKPVEDRERR